MISEEMYGTSAPQKLVHPLVEAGAKQSASTFADSSGLKQGWRLPSVTLGISTLELRVDLTYTEKHFALYLRGQSQEEKFAICIFFLARVCFWNVYDPGSPSTFMKQLPKWFFWWSVYSTLEMIEAEITFYKNEEKCWSDCFETLIMIFKIINSEGA